MQSATLWHHPCTGIDRLQMSKDSPECRPVLTAELYLPIACLHPALLCLAVPA